MRHIMSDTLKSRGYNLKERAKVYSYTTAGALLPLIVSRYGCDITKSISNYSELSAWIASAGLSAIPSIIGAYLGLFTGTLSATVDKSKRKKEELKILVQKSKLENTVQGAEK